MLVKMILVHRYQFLHLVKRSFHISCTAFGKLYFKPIENEFSRQVLVASKIPTLHVSYEPSIEPQLPVQENLSALKTPEVLDIFEGVAHYCRLNDVQISEPHFDAVVKEICCRRMDYQFTHLERIMKILTLLPRTPLTYKTQNFSYLWSVVEEVAMSTMNTWGVEFKLRIFDLFYVLRPDFKGNFMRQAVSQIDNEVGDLSKDKLLHFVFMMNISRQPIKNTFAMEKNFLAIIDDLTVSEAAILCIAFFKTETKIQDRKILEKLYRKLIDNVDRVEQIALSNFLKILRYSSRLPEQKLMIELKDAITPHIHRLPLVCCTHIMLLGTEFQQAHEPSLRVILDRLISEIKSTRTKDLERALFVFGLYDFETPDFKKRTLCELVLRELPLRGYECEKYPQILPRLLEYLVLNNTEVPAEWVSKCLSVEYLEKTYGKNYWNYHGRELLFLDGYAEICLGKAYDGHRLIGKHKDEMCRRLIDPVPSRGSKLTKARQLCLDVYDVANEVLGNVKMCYPLPYFQRPDLLVAINNKTGQSVNIKYPVLQELTTVTRDTLLEGIENPQDISVIVIVIGSQQLYIHNTKIPGGYLKYKIQQLEKCGFKTTVVRWDVWPKSKLFQEDAIQCLIDDVLRK